MPDVAPPREVFLSHVRSDRDTATSIANMLRRHGVPVWYSVSDIRGAQQWHDEIGLALRRCDWFLLLPELSGACKQGADARVCRATQ